MNKKTLYPIHNYKIFEPCRTQVEMSMCSLDDLVPSDHKVRLIWDFVNKMDTNPCFAAINTFKGKAGRSASSPKVLFALWLYSILDGNSSARKLEELCQYHNMYKWISGGIPINRTMLSEFRSKNTIKFEDLLTNCLAVMVKAEVIRDEDFSQDGTRVKANAGLKSFRREESLLELKKEVKNYIAEIEKEGASNNYDKRQSVAREHAAKDRLERVNKALQFLEIAKEEKIKNRKKAGQPLTEEELNKVRGSTTDPAVRKMKMGDGGFRLAYNVQFATGLDSRIIYGVDVVNTLDPRTAPKMMIRVCNRLEKLGLPGIKNWLGDAAYSSKEDVEEAAFLFPNCRYYAPPQTKKGVDPKKHRRSDSEAVRNWRDLIGNKEMENLYKMRSSTAEFSNAQVKNKGLTKFSMRGIINAKGEAILYAIAQNISRFFDLVNKSVGGMRGRI